MRSFKGSDSHVSEVPLSTPPQQAQSSRSSAETPSCRDATPQSSDTPGAVSKDPYSSSPKQHVPGSCSLQPHLIKTASGMTAKVLLCGDIQGSFHSFATTLQGINQRQGPFSCALCCGNTLGNDLLGLKVNARRAKLNAASPSPPQAPASSDTATDQDYLDGRAHFPIPVLFIDASFSSVGEELRRYAPQGIKLSDTLEYLGNFGVKRIAGLTVGFLSGRYNLSHFFMEEEEEQAIDLEAAAGTASPPPSFPAENEMSKDFGGPHAVYYTRSVLEQFRTLAAEYTSKMDLFVSCEWPLGVEECLPDQNREELAALLELATLPHSVSSSDDSAADDPSPNSHDVQALTAASSPAVSELVELLEPRYHVAAGFGVFYSRPVFTTSVAGLASRFVGLGRPCKEAQPDKRLKFVHALILRPMSELPAHMLRAARFSSTPSPYYALHNPKAKEEAERVKRPRSDDTADYGDGGDSKKPAPFLTEDNLNRYLQGPYTPPSSDGQTLKNGSTAVSRRLLSTTPGSASSEKQLAPSASSAARVGEGSDRKRRKATSESPQLSPPHHGEGHENRPPVPPAEPPSSAASPETRAVFVSNIPYEVNMQSFNQVMGSFGKIVKMHCPTDQSGKASGRAWIVYETVEAAQQAAAASDQLKSGGRLMKIRLTSMPSDDNREDFKGAAAAPRSGRGNNSSGSNLPGNCQAVDVRPHTDCWFCLANPNCERRLIIAIGDKVYVALAKGGMVSQHVLIIPVTHFPNFIFCPPDVALELQRYVEALRECYRSQNMEVIVYERYFPMRFTKGMHMQLQVIPIAMEYAPKSLDCFMKHGGRIGVELQIFDAKESMGSLRSRVQDQINQPYFYAELPSSEQQPNSSSPDASPERASSSRGVCRVFYTCAKDEQVLLPFNFGREVIADLTEMPQRSDWRRCVETEAVESKLTVKMRNIFSPFQPAALT